MAVVPMVEAFLRGGVYGEGVTKSLVVMSWRTAGSGVGAPLDLDLVKRNHDLGLSAAGGALEGVMDKSAFLQVDA